MTAETQPRATEERGERRNVAWVVRATLRNMTQTERLLLGPRLLELQLAVRSLGKRRQRS